VEASAEEAFVVVDILAVADTLEASAEEAFVEVDILAVVDNLVAGEHIVPEPAVDPVVVLDQNLEVAVVHTVADLPFHTFKSPNTYYNLFLFMVNDITNIYMFTFSECLVTILLNKEIAKYHSYTQVFLITPLISSPVLKAESLSKMYGKSIAIENITFVANDGEILGLLGANGAGKTTTLKIFGGLL